MEIAASPMANWLFSYNWNIVKAMKKPTVQNITIHCCFPIANVVELERTKTNRKQQIKCIVWCLSIHYLLWGGSIAPQNINQHKAEFTYCLRTSLRLTNVIYLTLLGRWKLRRVKEGGSRTQGQAAIGIELIWYIAPKLGTVICTKTDQLATNTPKIMKSNLMFVFLQFVLPNAHVSM